MARVAVDAEAQRLPTRLSGSMTPKEGASQVHVAVKAGDTIPVAAITVRVPRARRSRPSSKASSVSPWEIELDGGTTLVLVEQIGAVDAGRLGGLAGHLSREELGGVDDALSTVLGLR
ncbi:MAG: type II toxin-antitoxin system PemK/MazF family toxin [Actinomycetota bacterium]|nr:type II toxin-antitoxin system PemK/MazF family toxin [Actinomycetota bacterium]